MVILLMMTPPPTIQRLTDWLRSGKFNLGYRAAALIFLGLFTILTASDLHHSKTAAISNDAYIWQRHWTPALKQAIHAAAPSIDGWHILAAELNEDGRMSTTNIDISAVIQTGKPIIPVIRINGQLSQWEPAKVIQDSLAVVSAWNKAGLPIKGLEIDHDCGTAKLVAYEQFLAKLRPLLAEQGLSLHITALPAWLESPALVNLLKQVDEAVLQVHAVLNPKQGLFDPKQAAAWVKQFSLLSPVKFRIALPTYGSRIAWDRYGQILAVESESTLGLTGKHIQELEVKPEAVAQLLDTWRNSIPKGFQGLVWFRLPTAEDSRAWSLATWQAVMEGRPLTPIFDVSAKPGDMPGVYDIVLGNQSDIDGPAPADIRVISPQPCMTGDGVNGYRMQHTPDAIQFHLSQTPTLRARRQTIVGWVRCPNQQIQAYAQP